MSHLAAVSAVLPEHQHDQQEVTDAFAAMLTRDDADRRLLERVHANAGVRTRHLVLPLSAYAGLGDFGAANDVFIREGVRLGTAAVRTALEQAGQCPEDVDLIISTTITGLAVPSLDARIAAAAGFREDVKRLPLVGLGCVAGAAGIARAHDYLRGDPSATAVLLSVELCSLTVQRDDPSTANLVASGLFGDGAGAVVLRGADAAPGRAGIRVLDSRSRLYPDTERAMGWDVGSTGLRIVLGVEVPDLVRTHLRDDVDRFLARHGLTRADIGWWVAHPGGPKVLEAMAEALDIGAADLGVTWDSLARVGNLSSASVLHVLADTLRDRPPPAGTYGVLLALGPGFCAEFVLLRAD